MVLPYIPPSTVVENKSATEADRDEDPIFVRVGADDDGDDVTGGDGAGGQGSEDATKEEKTNGLEVRLAEPESCAIAAADTAEPPDTERGRVDCLHF